MQASVGPYMLKICVRGSASRRRRTSAEASGSPPSMRRTSEVEGGAALRIDSKNDGTELACVTRSVSTNSQKRRPSIARSSPAMTTVAPLSSGSSSWPIETSKPTETAARTRSPLAMGSCARRANARLTAARCGTATPFGFPVEPEV